MLAGLLAAVNSVDRALHVVYWHAGTRCTSACTNVCLIVMGLCRLLQNPLEPERVQEIITQAVEIEKEFITDSLPVSHALLTLPALLILHVPSSQRCLVPARCCMLPMVC